MAQTETHVISIVRLQLVIHIVWYKTGAVWYPWHKQKHCMIQDWSSLLPMAQTETLYDSRLEQFDIYGTNRNIVWYKTGAVWYPWHKQKHCMIQDWSSLISMAQTETHVCRCNTTVLLIHTKHVCFLISIIVDNMMMMTIADNAMIIIVYKNNVTCFFSIYHIPSMSFFRVIEHNTRQMTEARNHCRMAQDYIISSANI